MNLSDDVSRKAVESCRVIQLVLPIARHSSTHILGICVFRFSGPNAHEQTAEPR